ncbi:MAG: GNAT family N-acetyltransferase, partial [Planctomycetota bacterium]
MTAAVVPVNGARDLRRFRDAPRELHGTHPAFVPPLRPAFAAQFDRRRNPFWRHAESREWLAREGGRVVGRIGACVDRDLLAAAPGTGAVGFFDSIDDMGTARALFDAAAQWLRDRGCIRARGPLHYTIHDPAALLVDGFDTP